MTQLNNSHLEFLSLLVNLGDKALLLQKANGRFVCVDVFYSFTVNKFVQAVDHRIEVHSQLSCLFGRGKLSNNLLQIVISNVWFPALVAESPAMAFNVFNGRVKSELSCDNTSRHAYVGKEVSASILAHMPNVR
jgi:hypothetical protein